jgi:hypothetical protein
MTDRDERLLSCEVSIGFDQFGEPLVRLEFTVPGDGGVRLEDAEQLALHILRETAAARAHAVVARKMMLDGASPDEVVGFLHGVLRARTA